MWSVRNTHFIINYDDTNTGNCDTAQSTHDAATQPAAATKPPSSDDQRSVERSNELKHTVVNVAKIGLTFLKDSSDVFPPLKSLVGGLAFLLGNHEVCFQTISATVFAQSLAEMER